MKFLAAAIACLTVFAISQPARAMMPLFPLPGLAAQSDLIVQVRVVRTGDPADRELALPELNFGGRPIEAKPAVAHVRTDQVKIEKIYHDATGKLKEGDEIEVTLRVRPPEPPQPAGGPVMRVTGGGMFYAELAADQSYVLLLRSMGEGKGYYIPPYFKCACPAGSVKDQLGPNALDVLDVEKWNWGKADELGLQIGIPEVDATPGRPAPQVFVAVRNKSDKLLALTLDSDLKPLSLKVTTSAPDEKAVPLPDLYAQVKPEPRKQPVALKPGQMVVVSTYGVGVLGTPLPGPLPPGQYKVTVTYAVAQGQLPKPSVPDSEKIDAPNAKLWAGKIESAPAGFEVK